MPKLRLPDYLRLLLLALPAMSVFSIFEFSGTLDLPNHLARAKILATCAFSPAASALCENFKIDIQPIPFIASDALMALAVSLFPALLAERLLLCLVILLSAHSWISLFKAVHNRTDFVCFLAFPFLLTSFIFLGFYAYVLSIALCMYTVAYWWPRRDEMRLSSYLIVLSFLTLSYLVHLTGLLFITVIVCGYYAYRFLCERSAQSLKTGLLTALPVQLTERSQVVFRVPLDRLSI